LDKKVVDLQPIIGPGDEPRLFPTAIGCGGAKWRRASRRDLELILHPMIEDGKEPSARWR